MPDSRRHGRTVIDTDQIIALTRRWLEKSVIGLNLCPFAAGPYRDNRVRFFVSEQRSASGLIEDLRSELLALQSADPLSRETTLIVHPWVLTDFIEYNEFLEVCDATVRELDLEGELQVASFHPQYQFADTQPDDISNYTNRSPFPTLHLLREASVERAIAATGDTEEIYRRNIRTLRELGLSGWQGLMSGSPHELSNPSGSDGIVQEILDGLSRPEKALPSKLLYDAAGSELFQRITKLPTYYPTRTEKRLLQAHAADIVASMFSEPGKQRTLVEFGASDETKAVSLLDAPEGRFSAYVPIDISAGVLNPILERMRTTHPKIEVQPLAADFLRPLVMPEAIHRTQVVYFLPGSTIGQYPPAAVVDFLRNVGRALEASAHPYFVIGTDICRDPLRVLPAYNDPSGVSAAFNLNMLSHINHLTGSDLDPSAFGHEALWNPHEDRVDIYLISRHEQSASIGGRVIRFAAGEKIHTGMSYKYGRERFVAIAAEAGWKSEGFWRDTERLFGIHLFRNG